MPCAVVFKLFVCVCGLCCFFVLFFVCLFVLLLFVVVLFCSTVLSAGNREGVLYNVSLNTEHSF